VVKRFDEIKKELVCIRRKRGEKEVNKETET